MPPQGAKLVIDPLMFLLDNKRLMGVIEGDSNPVEVSMCMRTGTWFLSTALDGFGSAELMLMCLRVHPAVGRDISEGAFSH